ncbi:MAG: hypothetical protein Q8Q48_00845 [Candidatus Staskawiczbacteria bacterium]|nr:hypothetical protein [Candidatus Staskawiczbacteria bacterium]
MAKITIDKLAEMVQKGFSNQEKRFDEIEGDISDIKKDVSTLKKDITEVKHDLKESIKRTDKLEVRADYVENVLDIPAKK